MRTVTISPEALPVYSAWSAKETLYKVLGCQEVDFVEHLRVMPFEVGETGTLSGAEYRTGRHRLFQIRYLLHPDFVCTWCVV